MNKILIIDDFITARIYLKLRIKKRFEDVLDIHMASDLKQGLELMSENTYIHVICDLRMPNSTTEEIISEIEQRCSLKNRTFMSAKKWQNFDGLLGFVQKHYDYSEQIEDRVAECITV